jgi:hypothetical protein
MRADIVPGSVFPDYELSDHPATRRKLSELQGQHPMVLVLSRGGFCPKDRRQAELLVQLHRELEVSYCRHVPADAGRIIQKDLDIAEYTDAEHNPMIPHTIILEPGLVVFKIYNGYWFLARTTHQRRIATRPASRNHEMSPRLGYHYRRSEGGVGAWGERPLPPLREELRKGVWRAGLKPDSAARASRAGCRCATANAASRDRNILFRPVNLMIAIVDIVTV